MTEFSLQSLIQSRDQLFLLPAFLMGSVGILLRLMGFGYHEIVDGGRIRIRSLHGRLVGLLDLQGRRVVHLPDLLLRKPVVTDQQPPELGKGIILLHIVPFILIPV